MAQGGMSLGGAGSGATAGSGEGGTAPSGGAGGNPSTWAGAGGNEGGAGGAGGAAVDPVLARGKYLVVSVAQCGSCHNDSTKPTDFLGGNPNYKSGGVVIAAGNLTPDSTGLGDWTDAEIKRAIRDGVDPLDRQLAPAMPYWLFHNLSDADTDAIVAYLRSVPPIVNVVGDSNSSAAAVPFLPASSFPDTSLASGDAAYDSARRGKYLLTSGARCVSCHSVSTGGVPQPGFAGRPPSMVGNVFPPNLTPDATGTAGWTADDIAHVLLTSTAKDTGAPICSMPRYNGLTEEDALAIGNYLTTIPAVENAAANLAALPACP
jgi:mono/diheme cytochrome c family protein